MNTDIGMDKGKDTDEEMDMDITFLPMAPYQKFEYRVSEKS